MSIEQERADFEAWLRSKCTNEYGCPKNADGRYVDPIAQLLWESCQAGRASLQSQYREDAERYRWLRHGDNDELILCNGPVDKNYWYLPRNERLDEAIDHARRIEGKGNDYLSKM